MRTHLTLILVTAICLTLATPTALGAQTELFKLTAADTETVDWFGHSVGVSGDVAIVGVPYDDDAGLSSGSAYLFDVTTGDELFKLTGSDAAADDRFGHAVAISGDAAIVGARYDDDGGDNSGAAYIYDVTTGDEILKLTASDPSPLGRFGEAVGISGNTAIIAAQGNGEAGDDSGSAYLFDVTTGEQLFKLTASDAAARDAFGSSVAIYGNVAIVGAHNNDGVVSGSGSAYLFDVTTGAELFKLTASDAASGDAFGRSVAIYGNVAMVGAFHNDEAAYDSGAAYLFDVVTGQQLFKLTASDAATVDLFGYSVALSTEVAVVGAYYRDDAGEDSGSAYLFDVNTGAELFKLTASDGGSQHHFGLSVAIYNDVAIVGSPNDTHAGYNSGSAYLYEVPEPATLLVMAAAGLPLLLKRKRKSRA